jgi:hypothetical protein
MQQQTSVSNPPHTNGKQISHLTSLFSSSLHSFVLSIFLSFFPNYRFFLQRVQVTPKYLSLQHGEWRENESAMDYTPYFCEDHIIQRLQVFVVHVCHIHHHSPTNRWTPCWFPLPYYITNIVFLRVSLSTHHKLYKFLIFRVFFTFTLILILRF